MVVPILTPEMDTRFGVGLPYELDGAYGDDIPLTT